MLLFNVSVYFMYKAVFPTQALLVWSSLVYSHLPKHVWQPMLAFHTFI